MTEISRQSQKTEAGSTLTRSAGIIALGNIGSRALGLVREMIIADLFGARGELSAFQLAARIPTMTYDLLVGGMLSAALVPVFSEYVAHEKQEELWRAVSVILSLVAVVLGGIVVLLEIVALTAARLLGEGLGPELLIVMARLIRLVAPAILFFGLSGVTTGLLYSLNRFTLPAFASAAYNMGIIIAAPLLAGQLDIYSLGVGVFAGSVFQLLIQMPALRGALVRFSLDLSHPALRRILRLYLPVALGVGVTNVQVIRLPPHFWPGAANGGGAHCAGGSGFVDSGRTGDRPAVSTRRFHVAGYGLGDVGAARLSHRPDLCRHRLAAELRLLRPARYSHAQRGGRDQRGGLFGGGAELGGAAGDAGAGAGRFGQASHSRSRHVDFNLAANGQSARAGGGKNAAQSCGGIGAHGRRRAGCR